MTQRNRADRSDRESKVQKQADAPDLDRAGGLDRERVNPRRSGKAPVEQNDRTRDRELDESRTRERS